MNRVNYADWSIKWGESTVQDSANLLSKAIDNDKELTIILNKQTETLVSGLYQTYFEVFGKHLKY
jgi:hypothetical protein